MPASRFLHLHGHWPSAYTLPRGEGGFFEPTKEDRKRRVRNGEMSDAG